MNVAFLIIDMQKIYLKDISGIPNACEHINYISSLLREKNHLVIHIKDIEGITEDTKGDYEIIPEIEQHQSDHTFTKIHSNAFWNTGLEELLKEKIIDLVILSGFAAENCVLFTYNGAKERGFNSVLAQNGILSSHDDVIQQSYRDRHLISYPVIECLPKLAAR